MTALPHCPGCGSTDCAGCLPDLDPPRYCADCGGWLAVRVTTQGWAAALPSLRGRAHRHDR